MRLEPTPQKQREHNDAIHRQMRLVGMLAAILVISAITLQTALYFGLRSQATLPSVIGPDGTTILGAAVPFTPEFAIAAVEIPPGSQLSAPGSGRLPLQRIRTERINGVTLVLVRLQTPYPKEIRQMRAVQTGEFANAESLSGRWEGALVESSAKGVLEAQPAITIGDIASLAAKTDGATLGVSGPGTGGDVVISDQEILARFPELKK
jgi:hypothetical protein